MTKTTWSISGEEIAQLQLRLGMPLPVQRPSDHGPL
jgi:hypothetical protein